MARFVIDDRSDILVEAALDSARAVPDRRDRSAVAIITQPGAEPVARSLAADLTASGLRTDVTVVPDGEAAKTLQVAESLYGWLRRCGLHRGDTVVAVGGGTVTDLAGFVAATYLRGIEAVYVPTTLLAAVDAAIGGKTGVNLDGKNLVGVIRQPARVYISTDLLESLPDELWVEGAAEAFKAGMIGDPDLVRLFERHGRDAPIDRMVEAAVAVKVGVVTEDVAEGGIRAHLNYGHTVGHAVEVGCGLSHGRAVAVGMHAAAAVSEEVLGFGGAVRQQEILTALGLPVTVAGADSEAVRSLMAFDKKRDAGGLRMVLLAAIGEPLLMPVSPGDVDLALRVAAGG